MAVPKRKTSKSRKRKRRTHQGIKPNPAVAYCDQCQAPVLPHNACSECGYYKGRKIDHTVEQEEETT